jgi:hypothetical protein
MLADVTTYLLGNLGLVASLLATTSDKRNQNKNHKLWNMEIYLHPTGGRKHCYANLFLG